MNELKKLLERKINWKKINTNGIGFYTDINGEICKLIIGDFPDEDLFTLEYKRKQYSFNNAPNIWIIPWDEGTE